jgi:acetyl esterase/lipase
MTNVARARRAVLFLGGGLAAVGLFAAAAQADGPGKSYPVKEVRNVPYYEGKNADPVRHRLDLYLPEGKKDCPVLVMVHGGAWMLGDKTFFGWGQGIGRYFAGRGFVVVMPSYRLSPGVKHPEHVKDVARAVAWTYRHIAEYGGDPRNLFLCGHSAGGHLVALLATDPTYLRAEGLCPGVIRGVISVSGVYRVPAINLSLPDLSGTWNALRGALGAAPAKPAPPRMPAGGTGMTSLPLNLFGIVFGSEAGACEAASPLCHVRPGLPPFLLITADHDLPLLPGMARDFERALRAARDEVYWIEIKNRGHEDVMFRASRADDPAAQAIEHFVRSHLADRPRGCAARTP